MIVRWLLVTVLLTLVLAPNLGCAPSTQPGDDVKVTNRGGLPGPPKGVKPKIPAP